MTSRRPPWARLRALSVALFLTAALVPCLAQAQAPTQKANIVVIMGDDIGMWDILSYHLRLMAGKASKLDTNAKASMVFTDDYSQATPNWRPDHFVTIATS